MTSQDLSPALAGRPRRRIGNWILLILSILAITTIIAVWIAMPAKYRATASVRVESPFSKIPMQLEQPPLPIEQMDRLVANQATHLRNESLLRDLLKDAGVRETRWFQDQPSDERRLESLQDGLSVEPIPDTSFVQVSFATREPRDAPVIVNTLVDQYLARLKTQSVGRYQQELQDYELQASKLEAKLENLRHRKATFVATKLAVPGITEGINVVGEKWRTVAAEVTRLEAEKLQYKAAYENLRGIDPAKIAISPEVALMIDQDPELFQIDQYRFRLELEAAGLRSDDSDDQQRKEAIDRQLAFLNDRQTALRAQLENKIRDYHVNQAQTMYMNALQAEMQLRDVMSQAEAEQRDLDVHLAQYRDLEQEQLLVEDNLAQFRNYIDQLRMMTTSRGTVPVHKVGNACPPETPDYEEKIGITVLAVAVVILYGLGLLVVRFVRACFRCLCRPTAPTAPAAPRRPASSSLRDRWLQ